MNRPLIAITMGDPAGIGPEIVVKTLAQERTAALCRPLVVGDPGVMETANRLAQTTLRFRQVDSSREAETAWPEIAVYCPKGVNVKQVTWGKVDAAMGKAAAACLWEAFALALCGDVDAAVSAPVNKEAFHLAGYEYRDELAFLADRTGSAEPFTMGIVNEVWTVAVAEHVPFREIADAVTQDRVLSRVTLLDAALRRAGRDRPLIAVAALNVHGGEGGLFGNEEIDHIAPAISDARKNGIAAEGPIPADAVFPRAFAGEFDGVVCMYHDQANIARKLQPRATGATMFMGLPVVCGTTAHGTAFDKAGLGVADAQGLETALRWTARLASTPHPGRKTAPSGGQLN